MANSVDMEKAMRVYTALTAELDSMGWNYEKIEDKLMVKSGVKGDDLPINFFMVVKPEQQVVQVISPLPTDIPEDKRVDGAIAVCVSNYGLIDGSFDYDITDGTIMYRLTASYRGGVESIDGELFRYMIMCAAGTVDRYNDRFFTLAKGITTLQQFIEQENG